MREGEKKNSILILGVFSPEKTLSMDQSLIPPSRPPLNEMHLLYLQGIHCFAIVSFIEDDIRTGQSTKQDALNL
jgi:hypothetical protein